jgi:molecular chaperone HscB
MHVDLGKNYFELFGLPVTFEIDTADLAARYRDLQRRFHPDRYASAPDQERRLSMQMTALINEAFHTLKDPVARGRYLLGVQGISTDEETDSVMDPAFLMEQMELRESMDEARNAPDRVVRLGRLAQGVEKRQDTQTQALHACFADGSAQAQQRARAIIREMQFLRKVLAEIENLELADR